VDSAAGAPIPLPPLLTLAGSTPLVGRQEAWATLEQLWRTASGAARRVVLVPGEAGAGKTRLVTEFARHVHAGGGAVLYGTCSEEQTVPYQPFAEALDHVFAVVEPSTIAGRFGDEARELTRLLPRRAADLGLPQPAGHGDPDTERARLFGAVIGAVAELALHHPVLLVLDDLHWARRASIDLLQQLVQDQRLANVLVVGSYRSAPADTHQALRAALPDLIRLPGVTRLVLTGLDADGIAAFVAAAAGHTVGTGLAAAVDLLARETDGNPFLLVELWQHLVDTGRIRRSDGHWTVDGSLADVATPEPVREVVAARLDRLDAATRRLLELAAVVGPTFDPALLAAAGTTDVADVLARLDIASASRIVGEYGGRGYRFAHELIRRSVYDDLASADRRRLHLAVAEALELAGEDGLAGEIAQHLSAAVPLVDSRTAVAAALRAATEAMSAVAYDDAARFVRMALDVAPDGRADLLLQLADATMRAGDVAGAKQRCLEAHDLAERTGDDRRRVAAALAYSDASWRDARDGPTAARLLREALVLAEDETSRIRLQASLARALALSGDAEVARVLVEDSLASARASDDPFAQRLAFDALSYVPWTPQSVRMQLSAMREARAAAQASGDTEWEIQATSKTLYGEVLAGELDAARASVVRHGELARRVGQPLFHALGRQAQALLAIGEGRFTDAEALASEADDLGRTLSNASPGGYGVQLFSIRREQGRLDEARPVVEAVARLGQSGSTWRAALAVMYAELGLLDEARAELDVLTADGLAAVPRDALWLGSLSYLADACCAVGHRPGAAAVYDQLIGWRGMIVQVGHLLAAHGAVDRYLGQLATVLDHERETEIHFEAALRLDTASHMAVWLARTQLEYGLVLVGRDRPADVGRGTELLAAGSATARRVGMAAVVRRASRALEGGTAPAATRVAGLTDREVAVLGLIASGRSNREIGQRLHISQHTAANHVRSILMKTQSANRTEAAAWALRSGVVAPISPR
jgi:DNA-binding CsgD family transcriptional regulator/tetratricopeptide (TPR) repeat protein